MPYATPADMELRFGRDELIRLSAVTDELPPAPVQARVLAALDDASAVIDSLLRDRYAVPIAAPAPREIVRACCHLARFDLADTGRSTPSDAMKAQREAALKWLSEVAEGSPKLDAAPAPTDAMARDRARDMPASPLAETMGVSRGWPFGPEDFWP